MSMPGTPEEGSTMNGRQESALLPAITCLLVAGSAMAQTGALNGEWRDYAGDNAASRYAPLDQIDRTNVGSLRIAWRRPAIDASILDVVPGLRAERSFRATPLMVDGVLYSPNGIGFVEAFDAGTGQTIWIEPPFESGSAGYSGTSTRGVAYWTDGSNERILVQRSSYLMALDARTGKPDPGFGDGGRVNLSEGLGPDMSYTWSGAPLVIGDVVVLGMSPGDTFASRTATRADVRAYDVRTGELRWTFHVIPQAGEYGVETWDDESWRYTGHAPVWSLFSADEELGYVYMPVTAPTNDMYGGHRPGDNLFSQSIVCVDAKTGERIWHYQLSHHDLWDYDPPTAPILVDITVDGRPVKAAVQLTKQAFAFVFDRVTGEPVWPIEERPVPQSNVPGERTSPTQPFPTKPPAFDRQGATIDNLIDFTPELRAEALEIVKRYTIGPLFTPPTIRDDGPGGNLGTIELPGSVGGANWGGGAFDPETHILYVPSATSPFVADIEAGDPSVTDLRYVKGKRLWIGGPRGLPLFKPPYGRISAIDLDAGEIRWQVANGDGPRDNPAIADLDLPDLGNTGHPAPLLTKTLLFAGEGSDAAVTTARIPPGMPFDTAPNYGEPWFRAFDKQTGAVLARIALPAGVTGAPMTYMDDGKQYIVVAVGGREHDPEWVALSLP
jgi:glucose dehydrogenase